MSWYADPEELQKNTNVFRQWLRRSENLKFNFHSYSAEELYYMVLPKATSKHTLLAIIYGPLTMFSRLLEYETTSPAQKEFIKGFISRNGVLGPDFEPIEYPRYSNAMPGVDFAKLQENSIDSTKMIDRLILMDFASVLKKEALFAISTKTEDGETLRGFVLDSVDGWEFNDFYKTCMAVEFVTPDQKGLIEEIIQTFPNAK
ncbi:MAG: hypothetical protein LBL91_01530 [Lachnospiraceae bacterium]|nr:hypothetical protein [Lachnospiraceae bacterium]